MIKKRIIELIVLITFFMFFNFKVLANTNPKVYFVFDKVTYKSNETVNLTINVDQTNNISEVKLQIKINYDYLEPIKVNDKYFSFISSSFCTKDIINDYTIDNILRLRIIKEDVYNNENDITYKNNLCTIKFNTKKPIDNIYKLFSTDNYKEYGTSLYLFNSNDELITYETSYLEKIKISWEKESYELDVFSDLPNFKEDIIIENRNKEDYEYLLEKEVDTSKIGLKTVHIAIYDKLTADYIILSKAINIVDKIAPTIKYNSTYKVEDKKINELNLIDLIKIEDNYDSVVSTTINYYNKELKQINTFEEYKTYINKERTSYIKYISKDSSSNITETEFIEISIIDTTPPNINIVEKIELIDTMIDNFDIDEYLNVTDLYDKEPKLICSYINNENKEYIEILDLLKQGMKIELIYYGIDDLFNKTEEIKCIIIPIDTTKPTVEVEDITVNDSDYNNLNYNNYLKITDIFINKLELVTKYYINDELTEKDLFDKEILKGKKGYITYYVYDTFNNYSDEVTQNIKVLDTTKPVIKVNNINSGEKYINVEKIEYEITDNFENCNVNIYLDDQIYNNEKIEIGKHKLYIEATDLSGNNNVLYLEFEVIEDNLIGCGDDFTCYINNYIEIVIIVGVLLFLVTGMIIAHLVIKRKKEESM